MATPQIFAPLSMKEMSGWQPRRFARRSAGVAVGTPRGCARLFSPTGNALAKIWHCFGPLRLPVLSAHQEQLPVSPVWVPWQCLRP